MAASNLIKKHRQAFSNPNWSAFVLLVTLLSLFNGLVMLLPLPTDARYVILLVNLTISIIFWIDFVYLLRRAPDNRYFMLHEYGWLLLLSNFANLHFLRLIWFHYTLRRYNLNFRSFLSQVVIKRNAGGTLLFIIFTAIVIFQFSVVFMLFYEETTPGSNIDSVSDAFWWAFSTVTTVGYGDMHPITNEGRLVAVILMALGIALFSVITGSLSEWFRGQQDDRPAFGEDAESPLASDIAEIKQLLTQQEEVYLRYIGELSDRIADLEESLKKDR